MTATLSYIEGDTATIAGVDVEGRPFVAAIARGGIAALGRACWDALADMDRATVLQPASHHTTDEPLPDRVGAEGE